MRAQPPGSRGAAARCSPDRVRHRPHEPCAAPRQDRYSQRPLRQHPHTGLQGKAHGVGARAGKEEDHDGCVCCVAAHTGVGHGSSWVMSRRVGSSRGGGVNYPIGVTIPALLKGTAVQGTKGTPIKGVGVRSMIYLSLEQSSEECCPSGSCGICREPYSATARKQRCLSSNCTRC